MVLPKKSKLAKNATTKLDAHAKDDADDACLFAAVHAGSHDGAQAHVDGLVEVLGLIA